MFIERLVTLPGDNQFVFISCHVLMGECLLVTVEKDLKQKSERIAFYDAKANTIPAACQRQRKS